MAVRSSGQVARQFAFPVMSAVADAVNIVAESGVEERGAIFTKREVVDFVLDLVGYTADRPLYELRVL